jgi:formylglycine-generating enzyme required for sulfatase activity
LINSLGMKFVPVPIVGGSTAGKTVLFSVWETRVQDYEAFATETKRGWPVPAEFKQSPLYPAVMVVWDDATAFCAWLTERERKTGGIGASDAYRLPSDHEWSCAAGIGEREDAAKSPEEKHLRIRDTYPWGTTWPPPENSGNYSSEELRPLLEEKKVPWVRGVLPGYQDAHAMLSPVGSYAANRLGLFDLGGNAFEACQDWYEAGQKRRVARGGAWDSSTRDSMESAVRIPTAPTARGATFGFRCVLEVAPAAATTAAQAQATKENP